MTCSDGLKILLGRKSPNYGIKRENWPTDTYWKLEKGFIKLVKGDKSYNVSPSVTSLVTNDWRIIRI